MTSNTRDQPDWDLEQLEVIMEDPGAWQLVIAGPGAGKSAVACQRVAYLVDDEDLSPSRILLVSFTRTAIAELRDRIVSYGEAGSRVRSVLLSTIDSQAWSLRLGADDEPLPRSFAEGSYDLGIERAIELFAAANPTLIEYMQKLEHLIIDEAQDIVGVRAQLVLQMLRSLADGCGVTILADPAQAIYGFTTDDDECETISAPLLDLLDTESPIPLIPRRLERIHRIKEAKLVAVFEETRDEIEHGAQEDYVTRVQDTIRRTAGADVGAQSYKSFAQFLGQLDDASTLVLFRRRADALIASSYCGGEAVEHRLRLSGTPVIVKAWIGWLFEEAVDSIIARDKFDQLWDQQAHRAAAPFEGCNRDECWALLHRFAAGRRLGTLDLVQLRSIIARRRPPIDLCLQDSGAAGPILGTIHASKGREANAVILVIAGSGRGGLRDEAAVREEGRVYYVGATRARELLIVAGTPARPVSYLKNSRRVFRRLSDNRIQFEIGREDDVDRLAHLAWTDAPSIQAALANCCGRRVPVQAQTAREADYVYRLILGVEAGEHATRYIQVGEMSESFAQDIRQVWGIVDTAKRLKPPPTIRNLYLAAVTTVALNDEQRPSVRHPFRQSGFALAPVVAGFPMMPFFPRSRRGTT